MQERINHFIRQTGIIHPDRLTMPIQIIGAGGIGSWTVLALLKMGCTNVSSFDMDDVEEHNLGSQFYTTVDVGKKKVNALADKVEQMTDWHLTPIPQQWTKEIPLDAAIVISAVDSIAVRKELFESLKGQQIYFIDGRMAANAIELYTIPMANPEKVAFYESTLFSEEEADQTPCTERAVIYNTLIIGGFIADLVAHIANGQVPPQEIDIDLANFFFDASEEGI